MQIRSLKPGFDTLGVLMDFLAKEPPYALMRAGDLLAALTYQLSAGLHAAGFDNNRLAPAGSATRESACSSNAIMRLTTKRRARLLWSTARREKPGGAPGLSKVPCRVRHGPPIR